MPQGEVAIDGVIELLREFREAANISVSDAANRINAPLKLYEKYEKGDPHTPIGVIFQLASYFGVDVDVQFTSGDSRLKVGVICRAGKNIEVVRNPSPDILEDGEGSARDSGKNGGGSVSGDKPDKGKKKPDKQPYPEKQILEWQLAYKTGIGFLDDRHKQFIKLTNELYSVRQMDWKCAEDVFVKMVHFAIQHAITYLKNEEILMERVGYPEFQVHKREHILFMEEISIYAESYRDGNKVECQKFVLFLRDWILSHVGISDKKMSSYLKKLKKEGRLSDLVMVNLSPYPIK
jgi:hemerythrin